MALALQTAQTGTGRLTIKGELTAREDVTIDGLFEGTIDLNGHHLMMGAQSDVNAIVTARVVTVHGRLKGCVNADVVDVASSALVDASVLAKTLALEDGAQFNGPVNTERARAAGEIARRRFTTRQTQP
ncbi:MAG TPA: polymer-forming cytoskeletal protein [Vicinamibacterales bacterium]|nr:polymer-forming cytoskeletal protein [Vicinamibacterales bacterium]